MNTVVRKEDLPLFKGQGGAVGTRKAKRPLDEWPLRFESWSGKEDSNLRPLRPERSALPG